MESFKDSPYALSLFSKIGFKDIKFSFLCFLHMHQINFVSYFHYRVFNMHEVLDKPNNQHREEDVERLKYRAELDNEIEQIRIKQEQQVTFRNMRF